MGVLKNKTELYVLGDTEEEEERAGTSWKKLA